MQRLNWVSALVLTLAAGQLSATTASDAYAYAHAQANIEGNYILDTECNGASGPCGVYFNSATQTDAHATAVVHGNYPFQDQTYSDASAWANLATGELKIVQQARTQPGLPGFANGSYAQAYFQDRLHFNFAPGGPDFFTLGIDLRVDGSFGGSSQPRFNFVLSDGFSNLGASVGWDGGTPLAPNTTAAPYSFLDFTSPSMKSGWTTFGTDKFVGSFQIGRSNPELLVAMGLSAGGNSGSFAQFGHTAAITFALPTDVTFTSDSGVFLTEAPSTVPEPSNWVLLIAGFGLTGAVLRRRRVGGCLRRLSQDN